MRFLRTALRRRRALAAAVTVQALAVACSLVSELASASAPVRILTAAVAVLAFAVVVPALRSVIAEDRRRARFAQDVIRLSSGMLIVIDRAGHITVANPAACAALARPETELIGLEIWDVGFATSDAAASREALRRVLAGELDIGSYGSERRIDLPDGRRIVVAWSLAAIPDDKGRPEAFLVSGEDITEAAELDERRRQDAEDVARLRALSQDVAAADDARDAVVAHVRSLLDASVCSLIEVDANGALWLAATTSSTLRIRELGDDEVSASTRAAARGETSFLRDASVLERELGDHAECASLRYDPVMDGEEVIGILLTGWSAPAAELDDRRLQLLTIAAGETAIAVKRAETLRRLEALAMTDALTGVANRRAFDAELERAVARARREASPLCLVVLDLNEFKALNDREGHDIGDALLCGCVGAWEGQLRTGDMLARLGGDEFAVVLPGADAAGVQIVVDRLRAATPHGPGTSVGYAIYDDETPDELYQQADRALYRDKRRRQTARLSDPVRLAAVEATGLWDNGQSPELDRLAAEAADLIDCPGTYVTLVGNDRLSYAAKPETEPENGRELSHAYCHNAVATGRPFIVEDARIEPLTADSPGVQEGLLAYAGIPVADTNGNVLGALCACDNVPREWTPSELRVLDRYALRVAEQLSAEASKPTTAA